jgi:hypothetical protein
VCDGEVDRLSLSSVWIKFSVLSVSECGADQTMCLKFQCGLMYHISYLYFMCIVLRSSEA